MALSLCVRRKLRILLVAGTAAASLLHGFALDLRDGCAVAAEDRQIAEVLSTWRKVHDDGTLIERFEALEALARTRHPEALKELIKVYSEGGSDRDKVRELVAPRIAAEFSSAEFVPALGVAIEDKLHRPEHAWLAWNVAREWVAAGHADWAIDLYTVAAKSPFQAAAALRALAEHPDPANLGVALGVIASPPAPPVSRALLVEAAALVVEENVRDLKTPTSIAAVEKLIGAYDLPDLPERSRLVIGRTLARILDSDVIYTDAPHWLEAFQNKRVVENLVRDGYAVPRTRFMGIPILGRDVVYVIDCSGSMDAPFTIRSRGAATGGDAGETARRRQDVLDGLDELPADKIHTRMDAAKEALKASLRSLAEGQRFAVVVFADRAEALETPPRMVPAVRVNVERTCSMIDKLHAGGGTNLHRGLEIAFGLSEQRLDTMTGDVAEETFLSGPDTVMVLTDGAPNVDDYSGPASRSGLAASSMYSSWRGSFDKLVRAVRRWNLFRNCEIDCVGFSGAPQELLEMLANEGHGRTKVLGN